MDAGRVAISLVSLLQNMKEMQEALTLSELQDHILLVSPENEYDEQEQQVLLLFPHCI